MNCGYIALIGQPNVGKSTLINHLLGQKISITSRKPQTTRHQILGIKTSDKGQAIYIDTPGMHKSNNKAFNRYLNRTADTTLLGVDLVVWLVDGLKWQDYDEVIFQKLERANIPVILALNKIDWIKNKQAIFAFFADAQQRFPFKEIVPISALKKTNLNLLDNLMMQALPPGNMIYPEDQITDRSERFLIAEIIREKLTRRLGNELPYALTVEIEKYTQLTHITKIYALIWVERETQKNIVIGKQGEFIKSIGMQAREAIQRLIACKVYLHLWVKVKSGWSDNERALQSLGFKE